MAHIAPSGLVSKVCKNGAVAVKKVLAPTSEGMGTKARTQLRFQFEVHCQILLTWEAAEATRRDGGGMGALDQLGPAGCHSPSCEARTIMSSRYELLSMGDSHVCFFRAMPKPRYVVRNLFWSGPPSLAGRLFWIFTSWLHVKSANSQRKLSSFLASPNLRVKSVNQQSEGSFRSGSPSSPQASCLRFHIFFCVSIVSRVTTK